MAIMRVHTRAHNVDGISLGCYFDIIEHLNNVSARRNRQIGFLFICAQFSMQ